MQMPVSQQNIRRREEEQPGKKVFQECGKIRLLKTAIIEAAAVICEQCAFFFFHSITGSAPDS